MLTRIREPVTLIEALTKIGGLLVVLKISIILRLINEYLFERHLIKDLNSRKSPSLNRESEDDDAGRCNLSVQLISQDL